MNNLAKMLLLMISFTVIAACADDQNSAIKTESESKSFSITFDEKLFEVQFNKALTIPFLLTKDDGHAVTFSLSVPPSLGDANIIDNSIQYIPTGELGTDYFTISISDNNKTVEQEITILVFDRTPHLVLSDPIYGLSTELKDGVTVWGYNLGEQQREFLIELCDLLEQCIAMPTVHHWSDINTNIPKALEELNSSHTIQEIKFSIPETSHGDKLIRISNQYGKTSLPFTVRPKTFNVIFDETNFEVQFDKHISIPLNITLDEDHSVTTTISVPPSLAEVVIIDNILTYMPYGTLLGKDKLTISITDNKKTIEQELSFTVSDRAPHLVFSDLISGPATGLGDGKGSGVIVTVWGFKLGDSQSDSTIELCDLDDTCTKAANVYYWKNADGQLPSGPANLYESHGMQEIAFSIPKVGNGEKEIRVSNSFGSSTLPFTVRDGNIYHVTSEGSDDFGDGTFANPWLTVAKADSIINAGSTLYIQNVTSGDEDTKAAIYNNRSEAMSSLDAQFSYVAYPNTRPEAIGERGFDLYNGYRGNTTGFVLSKLAIYAAESDEDKNGQPVHSRATGTWGIIGSKDGRAVGNYVTDTHPADITGACPDGQQAAITASGGSADRVSNFKVFGNHIHDYGCDGTSKFQHTTYFTIRSGDFNDQFTAPEIAWNYLQDNKARGGLHYFDSNQAGGECGQFTTPFKMHNNIIINQSGTAINVGATCPVNTTFEVYNNVVINSGLKADFNDSTGEIINNVNNAVNISVSGVAVTFQLNFSNNIFYKWNTDEQAKGIKACLGFEGGYGNASVTWNDNVCYTKLDQKFIGSGYQGDQMESKISGKGNVWYTGISAPEKAIIPSWDSSPIITDPLLNIDGSKVIISQGSPLIGKSESPLLRDVYGRLRVPLSTVGAVGFINE